MRSIVTRPNTLRKFFLMLNFIYNVLLQPYFDVIGILSIRWGFPQLIPIIFYLKPLVFLIFVISFYRFNPLRFNQVYFLIPVCMCLFVVAFIRGYTGYLDTFLNIALLCFAFLPSISLEQKKVNQLFRLYIFNLILVALSGILTYVLISPDMWNVIDFGQVEAYKSGIIRAARTENFYGVTIGARMLGVWGEPLYFAYSLIPLLFYMLAKYWNTKRYFYLMMAISAVGLMFFSSRGALAVSLLVSIYFVVNHSVFLRRYRTLISGVLICLFGVLSLIYISYTVELDTSLQAHIESFKYISQLNLEDILGFSTGKANHYDPVEGIYKTTYDDTTEVGFYRLLVNMGIIVAAIFAYKMTVRLRKALTTKDVAIQAMSYSLLAYLVAMIFAFQLLTIKTLLPFVTMYIIAISGRNNLLMVKTSQSNQFQRVEGSKANAPIHQTVS